MATAEPPTKKAKIEENAVEEPAKVEDSVGRDITGSVLNYMKIPCPEKWFRFQNIYNFQCVGNFRDCAGTDPEKGGLQCWENPSEKDRAKWTRTGTMKRGRLFRTGQLTAATERDIKRLVEDFEINTYLDLRTGKMFNSNLEGADGPIYDSYPPSPWPRTTPQPHREAGKRRRVHVNLHDKLMPVSGNMDIAEEKFWVGTLGTLKDEVPRTKLLECLNLLADEQNYPVMFGCTAGKDRTGIIAVLIHKICGVSDEDITEEYLLTNLASGTHAWAWLMAKKKVLQHLREQFGDDTKIKVELKRVADIELVEDEKYTKATAEDIDGWAQGFINDWKQYADAPEKKVLEGLVRAPFRHAQEASVYPSVIRKTLDTINNELGGYEKFLDELGFGEAQRANVRKIMVST